MRVHTDPAGHAVTEGSPGGRALVPVMVAAVLTGFLAGLGGVLLILLLHLVQHAALGYTEEAFLVGVEQASAMRRIVALVIGGAVVGVGWWIVRRVVRTTVSATHALDSDTARMAILPVASDGVLQIIAVGVGASLGREGAPRELGAAVGDRLGTWFNVSERDRRILLAAGAGAGLAAVYNVPAAGGVFAIEALLRTVRPREVLLAALCSLTATATAWVAFGNRPTYHVPGLELTPSLFAVCLVVGPVCALGALPFRAAMTHARTKAPRGWRSAMAIPAAFAAIGIVTISSPQVLGNGKALAQSVFTGPTTLALAAGLVLLKPVATWLCLRAGAIGGLLTPAFATGAAVGALIAAGWATVAPGADPAEFALLGATAFLAVAQRIPVTAGVLALEFTHADYRFAVPVAVALLAAWITAGIASRPYLARRPPTKRSAADTADGHKQSRSLSRGDTTSETGLQEGE